MKRLYVTTQDNWAGNALDTKGQVITAWVNLFNPSTGSHWVKLDDTHILVATDVEHSEWCLDMWHGNPLVARLPHPIFEGGLKVADVTFKDAVEVGKNAASSASTMLQGLPGNATTDSIGNALGGATDVAHAVKNFRAKHAHSLAKIGVLSTDNVMTVSAKARAIHPLVCVSAVL